MSSWRIWAEGVVRRRQRLTALSPLKANGSGFALNCPTLLQLRPGLPFALCSEKSLSIRVKKCFSKGLRRRSVLHYHFLGEPLDTSARFPFSFEIAPAFSSAVASLVDVAWDQEVTMLAECLRTSRILLRTSHFRLRFSGGNQSLLSRL
jgi:hypothetical protein